MGQAIFTTVGSDTWTCPIGVTSIKVECWGGGGGGDVGAGATHGGGGAGGMYARVDAFTVIPTNSYSLYVGLGGDVSKVGEDSTFNTSTCIAKGGAPASGSTGGGSGPSGTGDQTYRGGTGATGTFLGSGGGGGGGGDTAAGSNGTVTTGGAGGVNGGGAGSDGDLGGGVGNDPGGGGGGDTVTASLGGNGQVIITWYGASLFNSHVAIFGMGNVTTF